MESSEEDSVYGTDYADDDSYREEGSDIEVCDSDFEGAESDSDEEGAIQHHLQPPSYTILKEEEILKHQEKDIEEVSTALSISRNSATLLLFQFRWNISKATEEWFANEDGIRQKVGLLDKQADESLEQGKVQTCSICYDEFGICEMSSTFFCGHLFCNWCWGQYLSISINDGPGCLTLRCPEPKCPAAVGQDMINTLTSDHYRKRYARFLVRSYIEGNNKRTKWCPAPDCDNAVEFIHHGGKRVLYDVTCLCKYSFCWNCTEDAHHPVDCETLNKWILKNKSDSENTIWILAQTKPCPKCRRSIEKNHGCMHMTCSDSCKHEFCWLCLGDWKKHGENTGGFYACNVYDKAKQEGKVDEAERTREMAKQVLEKYTHFYERWAANEASKKMAIRDLEKMEKIHMDYIARTQGVTQGEVEFIRDAWIQIIECRRVLKMTYAYGYYVPEDEIAKKQLFEYLQGEAEAGLERLHRCAEDEIKEYIFAEKPKEEFKDYQQKLRSLTIVTKNFFENLARAIENGLSDVPNSQGEKGIEMQENQ